MTMTAVEHRERGVALIELIVVAGLTGIVAVISAFTLINTLRSQDQVVGATKTATRGRAFTTALEQAVRGASWIKVVDPRTVTLRVGSGASSACKTFAVGTVSGRDELQLTAGGTTANLTSESDVWVAPIGSANYFAPLPASGTTTGVRYSLSMRSTKGATDLVSSVYRRASGGAGVACP
ncbi:type II secretion system protein [Nocardioides nematodiphilus]|uniref:type II secretion system protein n=1 Tax=Nocardioides nematodiphilus TaxID=2849669 RepID=UPI001CD98B08|nr:type II secretion system protein [Nocardioides nematodiphilus]MCA1981271.1 type II secretion system GspH family protein [Nocardioides nematodiphilus]